VTTLPAHIWDEVDADGDCWEWTGATARDYGRVTWQGRTHQAHRVIWEALVGPIPDGLEIDHLCRNRACVNPDHLDVVTRKENLLRSYASVTTLNAIKTRCVRGHLFNSSNTYVWTDDSRTCRTCHADRQRRYRREARTQ